MINQDDSAFGAPYNPFDAPIPGQSLTDTPGNYPWEHPPKQTDPNEVLESIWERITDPETSEQMILMMEAGVPVEALTRIIAFTGFSEGEFNPDIGLVIIEPLMKMITAIGMRAGVKNLRISLEDLSNKKTIRNIISLKEANKRAKQTAQKIIEGEAETVQEVRQGLLAKPSPETMQEEV